ncbi:MAG: hypothetical protein ACLSCV_06055 [Acutalibacteraceae bacterium]
MGTGGRAAVDGAMASNIMGNLVKAGLGFDCALKIVNSAMQVKSGEELWQHWTLQFWIYLTVHFL